MADKEKKTFLIDAVGEAFGNREWHPVGPILIIFEVLIVAAIVYGVFRLVEAIVSYIEHFFQAAGSSIGTAVAGPFAIFVVLLPFIKALALIFSVLLFIGIIHFSRKITKIHKELGDPLYQARVVSSEGSAHNGEHIVNPKWQRIQEHINSSHPSDWRFAILEADIMLDEILDELEYKGESMSEKLKQVERSDFLTIDHAWEAHKVRNQIAHEGSEFLINEREARRVIDLYALIFTEFKYI